MREEILATNQVDQYIAIEPVKQLSAEQLREEAMIFEGREYNYSITGVQKYLRGELAADVIDDAISKALTDKERITSPVSASEYSGHHNIEIPHIIQDEFTDFRFIESGVFTGINELFESDSELKVITALEGLQFLRIPAFRFIENEVPQYGDYYIRVSPKYIETTIRQVTRKAHVDWGNTMEAALTSTDKRRTVYRVLLNNFINTPWLFEESNSDADFSLQQNRLLGSVVQVISGNTIKTTKIITNDFLDFSSNNGYLVLSPDFMGYDAPSQVITVGDVIRIYPRETFFTAFNIKLIFRTQGSTVESLAAYLLNDAVRNLKSGIIEVYDENGVTVDTNGLPQGNVVQSFQLSQEGDNEIRRKLN